jgi:hypothetical protein
VVARHLLGKFAVVVLEDNEILQEVEETRPEMVRQGLNHSRPAVRVPIRASVPSEITSSSL